MEDNEFVSILEKQYFNPNVKFEVIMGALLRPILGDIVTYYVNRENSEHFFCDKEQIYFLGAEVPYKRYAANNRCPKIDFVLCSSQQIYLVELKTSSGSIRKEQVESYRKYLSDGNFRDNILSILISILTTEYKVKNSEFARNIDINTLSKLVQIIMDKNHCYNTKGNEFNKEDVRLFLKENNKTSTAKYLYLAEELYENFISAGIDDRVLSMPMKMIYITPDNKDMKGIADFDQRGNLFFLHIALNEVPSIFENRNDKTWVIVKPLIREIYKV